MWGAADYERVARRFAPIHDELVSSLEPAGGVRWLDLATGTGEIALRAARAGAAVTGADISERLLEQARAKGAAESLEVVWELADAQDLPYADGAFDVVSSSFGVIFAPDQEAVARELARVARGRLGLTCWRPNEGPHAIYERFWPSDEVQGADDWGSEEHVMELLSPAFELEFEEGVWHLTGESPEDLWEVMTEGAPPVKALVATLEPDVLAEFRRAMLEHWAGFRTDDGVDEPRRYLLVGGKRR
ncbi:MAG: methyltransferase domain-containing protein [Actinomycetota bacterium]|nr:methyltransferase domain-containing protein [Actinomycetota bacterium]